jgi:serine/threonine-protein kinase PpkA
MTPAAAVSSTRVKRFQSRTAVRGIGRAALLRELPSIPGYEVQRRVGQGRMSTAWLAHNLRRGGDVVLKILNASHARDAARQTSFAQEFAIPLAIKNKHVIRVFDQCLDGAHSYIAMEYLDGGDVAGWIRRGISASEAVLLLRQATVALAQVHDQGFVHCDVKPANLLLRSCGELVLADFGLARRAGAASPAAEGAVFGTPCYASPEQTRGDRANAAVDVYSLGALFYEMLCGAPPFKGPSALELQCQHVMAAVPRLPLELARFQSLVDAMLEKNVDCRLPHGAAVLHELGCLG